MDNLANTRRDDELQELSRSLLADFVDRRVAEDWSRSSALAAIEQAVSAFRQADAKDPCRSQSTVAPGQPAKGALDEPSNDWPAT